MSKKLNVIDVIGTPSAITQELGDMLYDKICESIDNNEKIVLDFSEIESMISPFLNNAIGKLYGKYDSEMIREYLDLQNIPNEKKATVNLVISNAKKYYANKDAVKTIIKDVVE